MVALMARPFLVDSKADSNFVVSPRKAPKTDCSLCCFC